MIRRKENLEAWNKFWDRQKIGQLKNTLAEYGQEFGFSSDAFYPFIQQLENPVNQASQEPSGLFFFNQLKDQFVLNKGADYQIISFFQDTDEYIAKLSPIKDKYPGSLLVSRKNFSRQVSHALGSEFIYLAILAILLTLGLTGFLLRNLRLTVIALIPVITGLLLIGAVTRLSGLALNIPALIAAMVVIGIVSDYGIFMVYYCKYKYWTATVAATSLAAITTLIGAGVLIFAVHPVLFSIGVTLTTGVLSGYLSSILIIPSVYRLWKDKLDARL